MENRRRTFRLTFVPQEAPRVELYPREKHDGFEGELVDLSVEGMCVRLRGSVTLRVDDTITSRLLAWKGPAPAELSLTLPARIVHHERDGEDTILGLHFQPTADPATNENIERTLFGFILAEQRRQRHRAIDAEELGGA
jgi:c-di-GMP-binding flagellar brake protein YcgR